MKTYLVRSPQSEIADGPFTLGQLRELAASELIQPNTLCCEEGSDQFTPFSERPDLWHEITESAAEESDPEEGPAASEPKPEPPEDSKPKPLKLKKGSSSPEAPAPPPVRPEEAAQPTAEPGEYYACQPGAEEADGPFSLKQLRELVDSGVLKAESLYHHEGMDGFEPFSENPELWNRIKPEIKASLKLKTTKKPSSDEVPNSPDTTNPTGAKGEKKLRPKKAQKPPSPYDESADVNRMLAAAEGNTEQTKHIKKLKKSRESAATLILPCLVLALMASISVIVEPYWEAIYEMFKTGNYSVDFLFANWIILFAVVDLILLIGIGLGQTGLFSLLRLRCAVGLGFFFFLFYSRQEWLAAGAMSLLQSAILLSTLCVRFASTLLFCSLALAGGGAMIWLVWFKGIVF